MVDGSHMLQDITLPILITDTLEMVRETFYAVTGAAEGVLAGDAESLALLADAGSPNRYDSYDPDRYETVKNILTELLQPQASDEGGAE